MLSNLKFSNQPVAWLTALAIVATVVTDYLNKSVDLGTAVNSVVVALGGVVVRNVVTPTAKLVVEEDHNWAEEA